MRSPFRSRTSYLPTDTRSSDLHIIIPTGPYDCAKILFCPSVTVELYTLRSKRGPNNYDITATRNPNPTRNPGKANSAFGKDMLSSSTITSLLRQSNNRVHRPCKSIFDVTRRNLLPCATLYSQDGTAFPLAVGGNDLFQSGGLVEAFL
jgi:hypothetical protein